MKDKDKVNKFKKYPLVALRLPVVEQYDGDVVRFSLNITIVAFTDRSYTSEKRMTQVYKPTLYPLYDLFMKSLKDSGLFMWPNAYGMPTHRKVDNMFWGTTGADTQGNKANILSDPLDAIEIIDLEVSQRIKCLLK
jgi:hypothetical protein